MGRVGRRKPGIDSKRHSRGDVRAKRSRIVNATERAALLQGVELFDEITASIDERTMQILEHRRRTAIVRRRGCLVRRMLLLADVLGLVGGFLLAEAVSAAASP